MKIVRFGMTKSGLLLLSFVSKHTNVNLDIKKAMSKYIMNLVNWLYTTSGYYDKTVKGSKFNFDVSALNLNYINFIKHLEQSAFNCDKTQFYFHDGFIMNLYLTFKNDFIKHYNITNIEILNGTKFTDRIDEIFTYINGKKVLVISAFDGLIKEQYETGNIYKLGINFPLVLNVDTIKTPYCFLNSGPHQNYFETLDYLFEEIKKKDFDIALLGCGAYGHMLTHRIHSELNKEAIYIGGCITNLFGILGSREKKYTTMVPNEYWILKIPDEYKPANYNDIEDGCYW